MSEHIPAWKRIGLKVKEELEEDPLAVATHFDTADLQSKAKKKQEKRARAESRDSSEKKEPKRQKLPKSERGPPPERDQLVYLKQYTEDKDAWKFSKQKQNWILKHVKIIDEQYEQYLINYFEGLQGGSQDRMVEILRGVVATWNKMQSESPKTIEDKTPEDEVEAAEAAVAKAKAQAEADEAKNQKTEKPKKKDEQDELNSVDADYAIRAKKLLNAMIDEEFVLEGIDDVEEKEPKSTEEKINEDKEPEDTHVEDATPSDSSSPKEATPEKSSEPAGTESPSDKDSEVKVTEEKKEKKQKKEKKEKKNKVYNNLSIEQVEATEWVSPEDYEDAAAVEEEAVEENLKESNPEPKKSKKAKKEKKNKKNKKSKQEEKSD